MASTTYADWTGIAPITIANAPGVDDYPVRLDLDWIDDDNGTMNADFSDIRFTDTEDNALSYWIESYTASTSAVVWVKVGAGAEAISVVYGNAAATSESSAEDVLDLFDDFEGDTLDTEKWAKGTGKVVVGNGYLDTFGGGYNLRSIANLPDDCTVDVGMYIDTPSANVIFSVILRDQRYTSYVYSKGYVFQNKTSASVTLQRSSGSAPLTALDTTGGGSTAGQTLVNKTFRVVGSDISGEGLSATDSTYQSGGIGFRGDDYVHFRLYYVRVRKAQATEPVCTVGTTESNASSVAYDDTVTATRYLDGSISDQSDWHLTVTATRYLDGSVATVASKWYDTVTATRYADGSISETGGHYEYTDTVAATRYLDGSIVETKTSTGAATPIGYSFIVDGEDYTTAKVINAQIRDRLNQVPRFDFRAHSLNATDLTHFKAGATVEIYYNGIKRCEGFIERFDEQQSSWFYDCTGYGVGQFLDHRRSDVPTLYPVGVQGENTVKDIVTYIVNTSCGFPATGATGWTIQGESGPDLLIFKIQNQKAMEHVAQLVQLADMDWFASFGEEGRVLTLGDASCVTHTATNLKLGRDILMSEEVTDLSKVANNIVIQSKDYFGNTILSSIGDYTNVCTVASSETLLKYDAESGTTLLYVFDHSDFPSSGSLYVSTESVTYVGKSDPASALHPHFYGLTTTASHVAYEPVLFRDGFYITGITAPFLDASPGTIRVGREDISYASVYSVDATTACVSGTLTRGSNYYAHGREAPVFDTTYTLASPKTGTSVATYGRKDEVISGIGYQDMNSLDLAAYGVLRRKCGWPTWGQGMIVGGDFPTTFSTTPKVGDWFYLEEETTTATTLQRITGLDYDMMRGTITINWGASEEYAVSDLKKSDIAMNQAMS